MDGGTGSSVSFDAKISPRFDKTRSVSMDLRTTFLDLNDLQQVCLGSLRGLQRQPVSVGRNRSQLFCWALFGAELTVIPFGDYPR